MCVLSSMSASWRGVGEVSPQAYPMYRVPGRMPLVRLCADAMILLHARMMRSDPGSRGAACADRRVVEGRTGMP